MYLRKYIKCIYMYIRTYMYMYIHSTCTSFTSKAYIIWGRCKLADTRRIGSMPLNGLKGRIRTCVCMYTHIYIHV